MPKGQRFYPAKGPVRGMPAQDVYETARNDLLRLKLNIRAINALIAGGVYSVNDLHALNESQLEQISGIGPKAVLALKQYLRKQHSDLTDANSRLLSVRFADGALAAIDKWALQQKGVLSRAEAVRRLVEIALEDPGVDQKNRS